MGLASLQVCMDSSDWLQGSVHDESGFDSSSPSGGDMLTCSRPSMERRLRPPQDQAQKCPRCDSTHTKFCYYNNYSLSQPRYFCKTCRRYWTKGGTLRNIPVGGGCRKNKKVSSKKSNENTPVSSSSHNSSTDLKLSYPEMQYSHIGNPHFMLENPTPVDFMGSKLEAIVGSCWSNYDLMGSDGDVGMIGGLGHHHHHHHGLTTPINNVHNLCSPIGTSLDENGGTFTDTCQRLMFPYDHQDQNGMLDVKPNAKLLSLDWQDQGYLGNTGSSWGGMMNGYGSSAANSLI